MAFKIKTSLLPKIITKNGIDSISFVESPCTYQEDDIQYVTEYYNPIRGLYDDTK